MTTVRIITIGFVALFIGIALGYALSVAAPYQLQPATSNKPAISLSKTSVKTGEQYTATLTRFPANTEIYGWTVNQNPPSKFSAGTTDGQGTLVLKANAPETAGTWLLVGCDKDQNNWVTTTLEVTSP